MIGEVERRTTVQEATVEYRDMGNGEKRAVISGYAAVFNSESRNLGGFVETIHPEAFDEVLASAPDVIGVFNHDRNLLLGRTGNGSMRLMKDPYGLRYEIMPNENTSIGRDVVQWVKDRTVVGSSFAFAVKRDGGDSWSTDGQRGIRRREVRAVGLLEDVGPVVRPAYDLSSVVVSRRAIEMALGETFRPVQTMANAAKRGLKLAQRHEGVDSRLICIAERVANREIVSLEEVSYLAGVFERCVAARSTGWSGSPAWIEWQLAGGDAGERWISRRAASVPAEDRQTDEPKVVIASAAPPKEPDHEVEERDANLKPTAGMAAAARRGLELHEQGRSGDGLEPQTVENARKIAARENLSPAHVRRMRAWFRRHKVDKRPDWSKKGEETPGYTAWQLWGGNAGMRWSEAKVAQMDRMGESEMRDASGSTSLPIADRDRAWDAAAAEARVREWAGGNWSKYARAFFYVDPDKSEEFGGYKLGFADIVDNELTAVPRAIFAVAAILNGGRGGVDIPEADKSSIERKVNSYYAKMANNFGDDSIKSPLMKGEMRDVDESMEEGEEEYPGTLTPALLDLAECHESIVENYGEWSQSAVDGSHYMAKSPFTGGGIVCANCIFYQGGGACEIVSGAINPNGVCKFWIIPEEKMTSEEQQQNGEASAEMPAMDEMKREAEAAMAKAAALKASLLATQLHASKSAQ